MKYGKVCQMLSVAVAKAVTVWRRTNAWWHQPRQRDCESSSQKVRVFTTLPLQATLWLNGTAPGEVTVPTETPKRADNKLVCFLASQRSNGG
jgi:hypothetical protein